MSAPVAARLEPSAEAAAASEADTTIARGHIRNSGADRERGDPSAPSTGTWAIVTREQTGGSERSTKG